MLRATRFIQETSTSYVKCIRLEKKETRMQELSLCKVCKRHRPCHVTVSVKQSESPQQAMAPKRPSVKGAATAKNFNVPWICIKYTCKLVVHDCVTNSYQFWRANQSDSKNRSSAEKRCFYLRSTDEQLPPLSKSCGLLFCVVRAILLRPPD